MVDRNISASTVAAYALWALSLTLCVVACAVGNIDVGRLSIIVCGAAVTATIRTYFIALSLRIQSAMTVTSAVRDGSQVRPLR